MDVKYIKSSSGDLEYVQIPIKDWEKLIVDPLKDLNDQEKAEIDFRTSQDDENPSNLSPYQEVLNRLRTKN